MATVELRHVWKRFGAVVAVQDFSLVTSDGEFVVLVGPSGCGKTSSLRMIAGLETVSEGQVLFDGQDVTDQLPHDRDVAMVFQNYALVSAPQRLLQHRFRHAAPQGSEERDRRPRATGRADARH